MFKKGNQPNPLSGPYHKSLKLLYHILDSVVKENLGSGIVPDSISLSSPYIIASLGFDCQEKTLCWGGGLECYQLSPPCLTIL